VAAAPVAAQPADRDTATTAALVRALAAPLAADLASGRSRMEFQRPEYPGWGVWDVRAPGAGAEAALRRAAVEATRGRPRAPADTNWMSILVGGAAIRGDSAELHVERGVHWCRPGRGTVASGAGFTYAFRRRAGGWALTRAEIPVISDPAPPGHGPSRCDA
jgi:hypothetical protein